MAETLAREAKEILLAYLREVRSLGNEASKRARFAAVVGELFPGSYAVSEFARGVEKLIRVKTSVGHKRRFVDAYYGNAIIEFERSLNATLAEPEKQLREYISGAWPKPEEEARSLLGIATDGLNWRMYRPSLAAGCAAEPTPDDIQLELLYDIRVSEDNLGDFWLWLTSILFRPQQLEPTAERFQIDFGSRSPLYRETMVALERAWALAAEDPEARLAFETWQNYLAVTYGSLTESATRKRDRESGAEISELEQLFLRHTYLASLARLIIWAALSRGRATGGLGKVADEVLSGRYFESRQLANLVEDDFFHWVLHRDAERLLAPCWERILSHLQLYDLARLNQDVLKGVYQQLIDPKDRHDLGEYYTPDWLCERIVAEVLPQSGFPRILDPACGSGSFLRAAIAHLLEKNQSGTDRGKLSEILSSVKGIDIHPVAVTISRATYVLALGPLLKAARKPVQIPVYLADSLFLPAEVQPGGLLDNGGGVEVAFGPRRNRERVLVPHSLIHSPALFDDAFAACTEVATEHAKSERENRQSLEKHLARQVPKLCELIEWGSILDALWEFTEKLAGLISDRRNSIWSFIIRNSYRPAMFRHEQFDVIIGNPPWLSYRYIADPEYQQEIKRRAVDDYGIAPKSQKLFTQMELATVFLAHSMATFARSGARLGFVMPRSVLSADQHQKLIRGEYSAPFQLTGYWDLRGVAPLFNVPACVLFARHRPAPHGSPKDRLPVVIWSGEPPRRGANWDEARACLHQRAGKGRVIYLGGRCALSTEAGVTSPAKPSKYQQAFRQGATIVPRSLYFVRVTDLSGATEADRLYWAETDPEQAEDAKPPYQEVQMSGLIEGRFLFSTVIAKHLLPFLVLPPATVILPVEASSGVLSIRDADYLRKEGHRDAGKWFAQAEKIWQEKRARKASRQTLYEWLDYQGKLTAQVLSQRHLVLYNAAGTNVSAACFDRRTHPLSLIVEHKVYWAAFSDPAEARYVTAILNSSVANQAIKPFQSTGLLGERDIEKKLLDLPIPIYSATKRAHGALAQLGERAAAEAAALVSSPLFPARTSLARQRGFIRHGIAPILADIDKLVGELLAL